MKKAIALTAIVLCLFTVPAFGADQEVKGISGTDIGMYWVDQHGWFTLADHIYIPQQFPQAFVRTIDFGTAIFLSPDLDMWIGYQGEVWAVLYNNGKSAACMWIMRHADFPL